MPMRATLALLPAFAELRQPVAELDPLELAAHSRMVGRRHPVRVVEAARGEVDLVARAVELESELGAALGAEAARGLFARPEPRQLAGEAQLRARHAEPGDERRAARAPADRAMAVGAVECGPARLVAHA